MQYTILIKACKYCGKIPFWSYSSKYEKVEFLSCLTHFLVKSKWPYQYGTLTMLAKSKEKKR